MKQVRSWGEIVELVREMQDQRGPVLERMRAIRDRYDGDFVVPLPDLPNEPDVPNMIPALVGELVDTYAQRASSVMPSIVAPPLDRTKETGVRSIDFARRRAGAVEYTLAESKWTMARRLYYRHTSAYATFSLAVVRDDERFMPRVIVRDPLSTYAEWRAQEELRPPRYVGFITTHSAVDLRTRFPMAREELGGVIPADHGTTEQMWEVVEWFDEAQTRFGILGPSYNPDAREWQSRERARMTMPISAPIPNRLGVVPVICPETPSLGRIAARLSSLLGTIDGMSKVTALMFTAQQKAVFPDAYAVANPNETPQIEGGQWKDGRTGEINLLKGVGTVGVLRTTVDPSTGAMLDRLETNVRLSTGLMGQLSGMGRSSERTGRSLDTLATIALDPRIQEMHELTQAWLPHLNDVILRMYREYWPGRKYEMCHGITGEGDSFEFVPATHVETTKTHVNYSMPGADVIQLTQILGSMKGSEMVSAETARQKHPYVTDADRERALIQKERLDNAMLAALEQQVVSGQMPAVVMARIRNRVEKQRVDIADAVIEADEWYRAQQATPAPAPPEGMVAAPESMPGLAGGPGMAMQPPAEPPGNVSVPPNVTRFRELTNAMQVA